MKKISIITVVYNDVQHIGKTIENVLKQTYQNIEYIVVDGSSSDGTLDVIKGYAGKLRWISEPDKGIYDAMMKGVRMATGEWILFRNCGDFFFSPTDIECVFLEYKDKGEDFIIANSRLFNTWGYFDETPSILKQNYMDKMPVIHPSTFIRRKIQLKYAFNLKYKNAADYCFFVEALRDGATYFYYNHIIALVDCTQGATAEHYDMTLRENLDILKANGADSERIKKIKKTMMKHLIAKSLIQLFPFFKRYFQYKDKKRGWIECSLDKIMDNV